MHPIFISIIDIRRICAYNKVLLFWRTHEFQCHRKGNKFCFVNRRTSLQQHTLISWVVFFKKNSTACNRDRTTILVTASISEDIKRLILEYHSILSEFYFRYLGTVQPQICFFKQLETFILYILFSFNLFLTVVPVIVYFIRMTFNCIILLVSLVILLNVNHIILIAVVPQISEKLNPIFY